MRLDLSNHTLVFQRPQLLVMRLRFFKIVWHNITLLIVLTGLVDMLFMMAIGHSQEDRSAFRSVGHVYIRICFILSRSVRLLGLVETVPVGSLLIDSLIDSLIH